MHDKTKATSISTSKGRVGYLSETQIKTKIRRKKTTESSKHLITCETKSSNSSRPQVPRPRMLSTPRPRQQPRAPLPPQTHLPRRSRLPYSPCWA